jgi:hypothetical protein
VVTALAAEALHFYNHGERHTRGKDPWHPGFMNDTLSPEVSILMPCLNEAETLGICIAKAREFLTQNNIAGEILVADNGSTDGSQNIAQQAGARIITVPVRGYGAALKAGIDAARGRYVIMGDSDDSYDFAALMPFVEKLRAGNALVMGNRFKGGIATGAMPFLHRYLGNPVLSFIGRLFFAAPVGDFHCGLRGFDRDAIRALDLKTTGMEFASEMIVKAALRGLSITEVPTTLAKDGRNRPPHLRTWQDGWSHLVFLLLHCPRWLFLIPGISLILGGILIMVLLMAGPLIIGHVKFDVHTLFLGSTMAVVGTQIVIFGLLAMQYAAQYGVLPEAAWFTRFIRRCTLEKVLGLGFVIVLAGIGGWIYATAQWSDAGFGLLNYETTLRQVIPSTTLIIGGLQIVFFGFFSSLLRLGPTKSQL